MLGLVTSPRNGCLENLEHRSTQRSDGDDKTAEESRQRFSFESDAFEPLVPPDFQLELSKLRIPVAEDLPRRIEVSREESREENENITEDENGTEDDNEREDENGSEQDGREDSPESDNEDNEDDDRTDQDSNEEEDDQRGSERSNEEGDEEDERKEEAPSDYEDYDSPKNTISYHYDESGEEPEKKPKKKRPHVDYEVTETIPHDTKTVRPMQKVYPLPPPCPGAPPPTYPTTEAPSTKMPPPPQPPTFPPAPTFPPFPKIFPDNPHSLLSQDDFLDSYFPTSFMSSSSSFPKAMFRMPAPIRKHPLKRYTPGGKESQKIHKRVANPRVILRYHQPTALVIRKVQHGPPPDRVIIRKPLAPPVKEVHIHHHHDTPGQVLHIHKDDDGTLLDTARFKANVEGQRLVSDSQYETATTGPFAEPPSNIRLSSRRVS
ncbi:unnamed protein product [Nezara viridula]|uniref:Uncharacterized protein n=1 Tax=Nezara viridula TaxID=85310 RepID=A0A9P0HHV3_NEZVI|nr:unnamed protein product [Nezara viridula]